MHYCRERVRVKQITPTCAVNILFLCICHPNDWGIQWWYIRAKEVEWHGWLNCVCCKECVHCCSGYICKFLVYDWRGGPRSHQTLVEISKFQLRDDKALFHLWLLDLWNAHPLGCFNLKACWFTRKVPFTNVSLITCWRVLIWFRFVWSLTVPRGLRRLSSFPSDVVSVFTFHYLIFSWLRWWCWPSSG